jgi:hypothetical protein
MDKLSEVSRSLGEAYRTWKSSGVEKDKLRKEFFETATQAVTERGLQTHINHIYGPTMDEAKERAAIYYPAWKILEVSNREDGFFEFLFEELPEYKAFTYVNSEDGYVYARQVSTGGINLDDDRLREENPDLYEAVTYEPKVKRQLKSLDELTDEQIVQIQQYMYEGKPTTKLAAPRKAKPEELEDG